MKLTYAFRRDHPFGLDAAIALLDAYRRSVAEALRGRYPGWDVEVTSYDGGLFDVVIEPEDALSAEEQSRIAADATHVAHRIAEALLAECANAGTRSAGQPGS